MNSWCQWYKIKTHFNICSNRAFSVVICPLLFVVCIVWFHHVIIDSCFHMECVIRIACIVMNSMCIESINVLVDSKSITKRTHTANKSSINWLAPMSIKRNSIHRIIVILRLSFLFVTFYMFEFQMITIVCCPSQCAQIYVNW